MKKLIYLLAFVGIAFTGCDPVEDIHNDVDSQEDPVVGTTDYTLTDDDYDALSLGFGSFDSEQQAKDSIPQLLSEKYPFWGNGSSVNVGYNLYLGNAEGVSDLTGSDIYSFSNSDYASTGSDAFGFYPDVNATDAIPAVLDAQVSSPTEGQIVLAKYKQYVEDPVVGLANIVDYNFAGSLEGWSIVQESGADDVWTSQSGYVQGNGYFGDQFSNVEWLVSPSIDLDGESNLKFQITQQIQFAGDASLVKILVSTDYTDDVLAATWNEIILANSSTGDMTTSEDYDFSAYDGQMINIAFKYTSIGDDPATVGVDEGDAARWRIESMAIKTLGATGDTNSKGEYFMYSGGSWEAVEGVYYLSSADFDSMGEGSGQPGQYNNFSSSVSPNNYLPTFLELTFPYGQEDEELLVIYDYFSSSSGAQRRGNLYTSVNGAWDAYESTIATTLQFGKEAGVWVPDNTIRYTLVGSDYSLVAATLLTEPGFEAAAGNLDSFGNFNRTGGSTNWDDDMMLTAIGIVLDNLDPTAAEDQKYIVTYDVYIGSSATEDLSVIKTGGEWVAN
ncbi:choice-of-anchor J domain-containing protein [Winogradskyella echinorum]|uniref:Choice-of-anchor J domain-containing protein n=1 Tax=Winogradskyella echinorum TaxID=538189 RepID=A0ABR6XYA5_9FLAO|nr:choice-of-anchor J domain-containing protein [Winogradskyella echinorum]MBC3845482.1 choice-of-anchor J domain-containing protein [Winogradskyella echinorum]MBC5749830.1 choice-of-anchor J domain-containing protein [Winogradskyella echinorum]